MFCYVLSHERLNKALTWQRLNHQGIINWDWRFTSKNFYIRFPYEWIRQHESQKGKEGKSATRKTNLSRRGCPNGTLQFGPWFCSCSERLCSSFHNMHWDETLYMADHCGCIWGVWELLHNHGHKTEKRETLQKREFAKTPLQKKSEHHCVCT